MELALPGQRAASTGLRRPLFLAAICLVIIGLSLVNLLNAVCFALVSIATVLAIATGVRRYRPAKVWTWWTIGIALVLFTLGGAAREQYATLGNLGPHRSLIPDFITVPGYVLLAIAFFGFVRARTRGTTLRRGVIYDGMMAGLAMLACTWVWVIEPVTRRHGTPLEVRSLLVCYPALSVSLVVITLQIVFGPGQERTNAERYLIATMGSMAIGDTIYMLAEIHVVHFAASVLDIPYIVAYVAAGACALEPSMVAFTESALRIRTKWSHGRLLLVGVAFTVPALLVLQSDNDPLPERIVLFVIIIALTTTAILQIVQALRSVERSEALLRLQALHDSLTGLPNRRLLLHNLAGALRHSAELETGIGLLFIDLDQFKLINDTLGHSRGDDLLIEVAKRLQRNVRPDDLVTRIGGDEFVIVLSSTPDRADALCFANQLRHSLQEPFSISDTEFFMTASIGLAYTDGNGEIDAETLIRDADTAMYQAKEGGRDAIAVYDDSMRVELAERVQIAHDLHHAISRNEFHLVYQPVVRIPDGAVAGVEALVRWTHPTLGVLQPARFIPVAEESARILDLGNWVLEEAIAQLAELRNDSRRDNFSMAVNISVQQLSDEHFAQRIARMLKANNVPGSALCIELTESEMMRDPTSATNMLVALRRLGIQLAVDDFGTKYSSLAYLKRLPIDVLKIDYSFVNDLRTDGSPTESLVSAIVAMANALHVRTIAEGVETIEQAIKLEQLGCDFAQGYYFARPMRADQLIDTIELLDHSQHHLGEPQPIAG